MTGPNLKEGARIAAAAALILAGAGCASEDDKDPTGASANALVCHGGNECSGMSECAGGPGGSDCAGMNECKGMGWSYVETEEECTEAGGTIDS
jgi:uncharacterized membrane protein